MALETNHFAARSIGVVGAGTMGVGIATTVVLAGHQTILVDSTEARATYGGDQVRAFLDRSVALGKLGLLERQRAETLLVATADLVMLAESDIVIEAVYEDLDVKRALFAELAKVCRDTVILHTNTSTLSVSAIAEGAAVPSQVAGTHYCNPAPLMKLVEVAPARQTAATVVDATLEFILGLGKQPLIVKDQPGFLVNRFLVPFENECIRALDNGLATVDEIDTAVTLGLGHPIGPFRLLDTVGLDVHAAVSSSLYSRLHDSRFAAPSLVGRMVEAGELGRKSGRGFYSYEHSGVFGT